MHENWQAAVQTALGSSIEDLDRLGGGDFAESYRATLSSGRVVFLKTHKQPPPLFFSTEATGLEWLGKQGGVSVPKVIAASDNPPYLALEWIETGPVKQTTEQEFGRSLAELHRVEWPVFGRADMRTTGSQAVPNEPCTTWVDFYRSQRLLPLARIARDANILSARAVATLEMIASRLVELGGPAEPSALLHGDLWAGNRIVDAHGHSWLIDPAAHGGHREFDLSMMRLFGGFSDDCFQAYQECFPLAEGWRERISLHQIAPLTVHAIKFGRPYISATEDALRQYS